jgi:hypothetical protein
MEDSDMTNLTVTSGEERGDNAEALSSGTT